jgi:hypothetical protein
MKRLVGTIGWAENPCVGCEDQHVGEDGQKQQHAIRTADPPVPPSQIEKRQNHSRHSDPTGDHEGEEAKRGQPVDSARWDERVRAIGRDDGEQYAGRGERGPKEHRVADDGFCQAPRLSADWPDCIGTRPERVKSGLPANVDAGLPSRRTLTT